MHSNIINRASSFSKHISSSKNTLRLALLTARKRYYTNNMSCCSSAREQVAEPGVNVQAKKKMTTTNKNLLIFQLGTNNWQREGEYAPGSGILHEAHHAAYNQMDGVTCYSIYPSEKQTPHEDPQVRVFKLSHPIPICESASPVSSYRWHSMSEEEFTKYRERLENEVYDMMAFAEEREGKPIDVAIAHHTFLNPLVLRNVIRRRKAEGKGGNEKLICFCHGTAIKMYKHELKGENQEEYPMRFHKLLKEEGIFNSAAEHGAAVELCFAISMQQIEALASVFPEFDKERVVISPNGINQLIFHKQDVKLPQVLEELSTVPYEGSEEVSKVVDTVASPQFDKMVLFIGKFADWKRLDVLLKAAAVYEKSPGFEKTCTVIVGSGPQDAQKLYQDMAKELGLERTFFVGPRPQPMLAKLYSVANVGVFPSKNEPFGMVFVECMACGAPVIGADSGGPRDFVDSSVGELIPESDDHDVLASSLADAIQRSINEDWRNARGAACTKLVEEKYSVSVQCRNLLADARKKLQLE